MTGVDAEKNFMVGIYQLVVDDMTSVTTDLVTHLIDEKLGSSEVTVFLLLMLLLVSVHRQSVFRNVMNGVCVRWDFRVGGDCLTLCYHWFWWLSLGGAVSNPRFYWSLRVLLVFGVGCVSDYVGGGGVEELG